MTIREAAPATARPNSRGLGRGARATLPDAAVFSTPPAYVADDLVHLELFDASEHLGGAAEVLHRVRVETTTYPPPIDAADTPEALAAWLDDGDDYLCRWVATSDGRVAGHVALAKPHDYVLDLLDGLDRGEVAHGGLVEIAKFFVDPKVQERGVGARLFAQALDYAARSMLTPVLAVVSTSTAARRFYGRHGMTEVGQFAGKHGVNHVFVLSQKRGYSPIGL